MLRQALVGKGCAASDGQLQSDQIEAGDFLSHGVLYLEARVRFHEHKAFGCLRPGINEKLNRADAAIVDPPRQLDRGFVHRRTRLVGERKRRRNLDELLALTLQRTLAIPEVNGVASPIAKDLNFHMTRKRQEFLDVEISRTERRGCL